MIKAVLDLLPDWILPLLLGIAVWFGLNYLVLTPLIADRTILQDCPRAERQFCKCMSRHMLSSARVDLTLWTATLTTYDVRNNPKITRARLEAGNVCRK